MKDHQDEEVERRRERSAKEEAEKKAAFEREQEEDQARMKREGRLPTGPHAEHARAGAGPVQRAGKPLKGDPVPRKPGRRDMPHPTPDELAGKPGSALPAKYGRRARVPPSTAETIPAEPSDADSAITYPTYPQER